VRTCSALSQRLDSHDDAVNARRSVTVAPILLCDLAIRSNDGDKNFRNRKKEENSPAAGVKQEVFGDGLAERPGLHQAVKELNAYREQMTPKILDWRLLLP